MPPKRQTMFAKRILHKGVIPFVAAPVMMASEATAPTLINLMVPKTEYMMAPMKPAYSPYYI